MRDPPALFYYKHNLHKYLTLLQGSGHTNPLKTIPQFSIYYLEGLVLVPGAYAGIVSIGGGAHDVHAAEGVGERVDHGLGEGVDVQD